MSIIGPVRTVRARKAHACFLCPLSIEPGATYLTWAWKGDQSVTTMRAHAACNSYAHDRIDAWTNGDGCDEDAVWTDIREEIIEWKGGEIVGIDAKAEAQILVGWPDLAPLVARVRADIDWDVREDRGEK